MSRWQRFTNEELDAILYFRVRPDADEVTSHRILREVIDEIDARQGIARRLLHEAAGHEAREDTP